jgi:beta-galactosidase
VAVVVVLLVASAWCPAQQPLTFDDGWKFARGDPAGATSRTLDDTKWESVDLPHDWSIDGPIAADNSTGSPGGFFPAGIGWYRKTFAAPKEWTGKHVAIDFDGVYMLSAMYINGQKLGTHVYGCTPFAYDLTPHLMLGGTNMIAVRVDNSRQPNSRWYSGSGIYRHVRIDVRNPLHIAPNGIFVKTEELSDGLAKLDMSITAENDGDTLNPRVDFATHIFEADSDGKALGNAIASFAPVVANFQTTNGVQQTTSTVHTTATLPNPKPWSPEHPNLYVAVTTASLDGRIIDTRETTFGVRTIAVSVESGFVLNGKPIKLYGACVHDDNGPLGVAAFDRAEIRRAELLKAAGFNAVRCAHNPPAPAFLDACDRLGLLVMDEAFDSWAYGKLPQDYAQYFDANWQSDIDAMMLRDRNHPSIVMWSLGNEIHDFGSAQGLRNGTKLVERARTLDPTRFLTTAVYWYPGIGDRSPWTWNDADGLMSKFDIVGYNYSIWRYEGDHSRMPSRIIVGTESYPHDIFVAWQYSTKLSYVLGDFVWTGIDYLGESGIGRYYAPDEKIYFHGQQQQFPYHGAYCGDIDITGFRKPISYDRNIVWDRGEKLYTSIIEPAADGRHMKVADWGIVPSRASWTWPGYEGKPLQVQIYSRYDAVRLYLNDVLIGEKLTAQAQEFKAVFDVPYAPGILKTIGIRNGQDVESNLLRATGPITGLRLTADRTQITADGQDLSFVTVESVDRNGNFEPNGDQSVTFSIDGPATIAGVGSGDFGGVQPYQGNQRKLYQGRAQCVIRATHTAGTVTLKASATGIADSRMQIMTH